MKEPIPFTPREQFLISYFRDRKLSGRGHALAYHVALLIAPLLCGGLYFWRDEVAWIFVGYAFLLYRVGQSLWSEIAYSDSYAGIFEKYEARIRELEQNPKASV